MAPSFLASALKPSITLLERLVDALCMCHPRVLKRKWKPL
jgi:hypothetical protein